MHVMWLELLAQVEELYVVSLFSFVIEKRKKEMMVLKSEY